MRADITVTNVNTYGLAKAKFLAVRPHYADDFFKLEVDVDLPKVLIEGNYKADGAMKSFQIGGEGTSSGLLWYSHLRQSCHTFQCVLLNEFINQ